MINTPTPKFDSDLTKTILELEHLKNRPLKNTTSESIFLQLKSLLHAVEAVTSARIEGNHTTIASYIEKRDDDSHKNDEQIIEISNLIDGLDFIDRFVMEEPISADFIKELHRIVVGGLTHEGDKRAGAWRDEPRHIANAKHQPPEPYDVPDLMRELIDYINNDEGEQYDLLKIAIANHRFVWIHPFGNGNGRTDRLMTYALLCKKGYIAPNKMRLFNPTSIFAGDRNKYYDMLALADDYKDKHILEWCEYFLSGVRNEIKKSESLADADFVNKKILLPSVDRMEKAGVVSKLESNILGRAVRLGAIKASDIKDLWGREVTSVAIAQQIKKLRDRNLVKATHEGGREYEISFENSELTRVTLEQMDLAGLLPIRVDR